MLGGITGYSAGGTLGGIHWRAALVGYLAGSTGEQGGIHWPAALAGYSAGSTGEPLRRDTRRDPLARHSGRTALAGFSTGSTGEPLWRDTRRDPLASHSEVCSCPARRQQDLGLHQVCSCPARRQQDLGLHQVCSCPAQLSCTAPTRLGLAAPSVQRAVRQTMCPRLRRRTSQCGIKHQTTRSARASASMILVCDECQAGVVLMKDRNTEIMVWKCQHGDPSGASFPSNATHQLPERARLHL